MQQTAAPAAAGVFWCARGRDAGKRATCKRRCRRERQANAEAAACIHTNNETNEKNGVTRIKNLITGHKSDKPKTEKTKEIHKLFSVVHADGTPLYFGCITCQKRQQQQGFYVPRVCVCGVCDPVTRSVTLCMIGDARVCQNVARVLWLCCGSCCTCKRLQL